MKNQQPFWWCESHCFFTAHHFGIETTTASLTALTTTQIWCIDPAMATQITAELSGPTFSLFWSLLVPEQKWQACCWPCIIGSGPCGLFYSKTNYPTHTSGGKVVRLSQVYVVALCVSFALTGMSRKSTQTPVHDDTAVIEFMHFLPLNAATIIRYIWCSICYLFASDWSPPCFLHQIKLCKYFPPETLLSHNLKLWQI